MTVFKLNLSSLIERLDQNPLIHHVSMERKFPNVIRINIKERAPIARILLDKIYILDKFGVLMKEDSPEFNNLPLIHGINEQGKRPGDWIPCKSLAPSLKMIHYLNQLEFFQNHPVRQVEVKALNHAVFTTQGSLIQIRMNLENPNETFENLKMVLGLGGFSQTDYEYIDLSFRNQVIVKPALFNDKVFHRS